MFLLLGEKKCPKCGLSSSRKHGKRNGKQRYRCDNCKHIWGGETSKDLCFKDLYNSYCFNNRTYNQLAVEYHTTIKTIQKWLDLAVYERKCISPCSGYIVMDTTYFTSIGGIMLFRLWDGEKHTGTNVLRYYVAYETNESYRQGIKAIQEMGITILGIIVDGRKGLLGGFGEVPTQLCHFHQKAIIRRLIGKNPTIAAHKELKDLLRGLGKISQEVWIEWLCDLKNRYRDRLNEKNEKGSYKHRKARTCFRGLTNHLPYLFVYVNSPGMPCTTNSGEGLFGWIKSKSGVHRGLVSHRLKKFIDRYLNGQ